MAMRKAKEADRVKAHRECVLGSGKAEGGDVESKKSRREHRDWRAWHDMNGQGYRRIIQ